MSVTTAETTTEQLESAAEPTALPSSRPRRIAWIWPITLLSVLLGAVLALAIRTQAYIRSEGLPGRGSIVGSMVLGYRETNEQYREEIKRLRQQLTDYENAMADRDKSTSALNETLQKMKILAGLSRIKGPGLIISLRDSPLLLPEVDPQQVIVHDTDINAIINELKAAGAEAIGIGGADPDIEKLQRLTSRTTVRCVGPSAIVNDTRLGAPYRIHVIGNPKELLSQLMMPGGVIKTTGLDVLKMITIEETAEVVLPEYSGRLEFKFAEPALPPETDE